MKAANSLRKAKLQAIEIGAHPEPSGYDRLRSKIDRLKGKKDK